MVKKRIVLSAVVVLVLTVTTLLIISQFSSLQTQVADLQTRNSELESQNSDLQNQTIWLQDQNRQLQDQISQLLEQLDGNYGSPVKITAFEWDGGFYPIVGVTLYHPVNVTIRNYAAVNVSGLSLTARLINKYDNTQIGTSGGTDRIEPLQAGETREISVGAYTTIGTSLDEAACVVTLKSGNTVLDEWTRSIS
jgi:FtsZ-binding cell division protein ZapB